MLTLAQVLDRETWRGIAPDVALDDREPVACTIPGADALEDLRREGYVHQPGVVPASVIATLAAGVQALVAHDVMPVFLWLYAAPWQLFRGFDPFLRAALGADYRVLPEIWTWFVPPSDDAAGWHPHRDQRGVQSADDGAAHSTHDLGPAHRRDGAERLHVRAADAPRRRLPQAGHAQRREAAAGHPRPARSGRQHNRVERQRAALGRALEPPRDGAALSIACQFQRAREPVLGRPLLAPVATPSFEARAFLVARALLSYGQVTLADDVRALAEELKSALYERLANG